MTLTPSIKLTKRYFFSLPAGKFLASNCYKPAETLAEIKKIKPGTVMEDFGIVAGENAYSVGIAPGISPDDIAKAIKSGGIIKGSHVPVFAETVAPLNEREAQWDRIKESGAASRVCHLYENRSAYDKFGIKWGDPNPAHPERN